ncbi:TPA: hypothetical protein H7U90_003466 [Escherichia coli]|nr:hypothetical protein [Escherichia coli]
MVPKLRFYRFLNNDEYKWQSKKITDISKTFIGLVTTMTSSYVDNGVKLIRNSDIKENYVEKSKLIKLDISFAEQYGSRKLKSGDVVTVHTGDIGVSAVIDEELDGCLGFATLNTRPNPTIINSKYLCQYFNSPYYIKYALSMATGDGRNNYNLKDFNNAIIPVPCIDEQTKIADFLFSVDEKIALLNKQYNLLSQYKKGMMQKIFSQELLFKDENGEEFSEWNRKFIGNILTIGSGRDYKHLNAGNVPVFGTGGFMTMVDQYLFEGETVCIGRKGTIDKPFYYNGKIWTVDTLFYTHEFKGAHPKFVYQLFLTINWKVYNEASGVPGLSKNTIEKIEVNIPCLSEQNKISSFLSTLDDKIAAKKAELDKLKTWKQGLLQQMFV